MNNKNIHLAGSKEDIFRTKKNITLSTSLITDTLKLCWLHLILKIHRVSYGKRVRGNSCLIKNKGRIELGNQVYLNSYPDGARCRTALLTHCDLSLIKIGNNCLLNGTTIHSRKAVIIGDNCMFGPGVIILDNDSHNISTNPITRRFGKIAEDKVIIGNNVWIGMYSIILKGVQIGNNSIIAAGSIVSKSIPSNQLFGGNPARFIKKLVIE